MFVTTSGRTNDKMIAYGKKIANQLNIPFINRNKKSLEVLQVENQDDCIVVGKERLELFTRDSSQPFFFHPNSANFRMKRLLRGEHDPFVQATNLKPGMTLIDCTMGLASDSIIASFMVGESGKVISIEGNPYLSFLVKEGLHSWQSDIPEMNEAMRRLSVFNTTYREFLKNCPDKIVDVIYFDPMFEETIHTSTGLQALKRLAIYGSIEEDIIQEAKRVAKYRIVVKDHFRSPLFHHFNFQVHTRKSAKFHFGVIHL